MDLASPERSPLRLSPIGVAAGLLGLTLVAWILVFDRMRGMDAGPGTDLGGLGWFIGIWVTMMAAMMLPSVAPMVLAFARVTKERARREKRSARLLSPCIVNVTGCNCCRWTWRRQNAPRSD